jgi:hypothetical protein
MIRWIKFVMRVIDSYEFMFPFILVVIIIALLFAIEFLTRTRPLHMTQS